MPTPAAAAESNDRTEYDVHRRQPEEVVLLFLFLLQPPHPQRRRGQPPPPPPSRRRRPALQQWERGRKDSVRPCPLGGRQEPRLVLPLREVRLKSGSDKSQNGCDMDSPPTLSLVGQALTEYTSGNSLGRRPPPPSMEQAAVTTSSITTTAGERVEEGGLLRREVSTITHYNLLSGCLPHRRRSRAGTGPRGPRPPPPPRSWRKGEGR